MNIKLAKAVISVLMASTLVIGSSQMVFAKVGQESISVHYNGIAVASGDNMAIITQKEPFIYKNMVYVPIRTVSEELGYKVTWDNSTSSVHLEKNIEISFINRNITKDAFYGLEYEIPKNGEMDTWGVDAFTRSINLEDGYILMYFYPDNEDWEYYDSLWEEYDWEYYDSSWEDYDSEYYDSLWEEYDWEYYDSLWEEYYLEYYDSLWEEYYLEYYDSLWEEYDWEYYDSLWEDYDSEYYDSWWEEYESLWEGNPFIEKEIKTKTGNIYIYYHMNNKFTEEDVKEKFDEFMNNTVLKTGQESIWVTYKDIKIIFNGKEASVEREPFIYDGTVYLAVRDLAKALNKEVEWNDRYSVVKIENKPEISGFVFDTTNEYEIVMDAHGDFICYFENGRGFVMHYESVDFEIFKGEENIKELEKEKQKEFNGIDLNLTDYKFTEVNGREYLILDYEGYTVLDIMLAEMPKVIIMRADTGVVVAMYVAYMGDNSKDLELFEKLMFTVATE